MRARTSLSALFFSLLLLAAACGGGGGDTGSADATGADGGAATGAEPAATGSAPADDANVAESDAASSAAPEAPEDADLVIWADDVRVDPMRQLGEQFGQDQGVTVAVQEVAFEDIRGQLQQAGPAGEGPDMIVGANDWIGELVTNGAIAPIDLPNPDDFQEVAIQAFTWDDQLYGVPFAVENLALYRNTDLVPEAPKTWQDVVDTSLQLQKDGEVEQAFLIPASPDEAPYHFHPILTGFGGYYFELTDSGYDTSDIGIDSQGAIKAGRNIREWVEMGLINPDVDGGIMQERFGAGEAAFAVSGPWALVQDGAGFQETGVNFAVDPFPTLGGNPMQPFVGVQGVMISAFSENNLLAQSFVTQTVASEEAQITMFEANSRPPALISAAEQATSDSPIFAAFSKAAEPGVPLPAVPAMSSVFTAMGDAYTLIMSGNAAPPQALKSAAQTAREAVQGG